MRQLAPSVAATGPAGTGGTAAAGAGAESADAGRVNPAALAAVTAIGYYLGSLFGLELQTTPSAISSLWPPNAFLLGVLLLLQATAGAVVFRHLVGEKPRLEPRLFEPLFTTGSKGLGMSLSITRTLVEAHNGTIRAESNPDGGARFAIDLPVVQGSSS